MNGATGTAFHCSHRMTFPYEMHSMVARSPLFRLLGIACLATLPLVAACEDEVVAPDQEEHREGVLTIDATSPTDYVYLSLAGEGSVVEVDDPASSTEWDLAFRRYAAKLNGGVAGPGSVRGASLATHAGATADEIVALTPADGEAAFAAVTESAIAGADFSTDGLVADDGGPWFRFDPRAGTLAANPAAAWKVATADGGHGLFRVIHLDMAGHTPLGATLEVRHQPAGGTLGEAFPVEVDFADGVGYIDLSSATTTAGDGCGWDLSIAPTFAIELNAACGAGTFPLDATDDFTALSVASDAPAYGPFLATISGAIPATTTDASGLFWYNIEGNSRMWPTFNVFLIEVDGAVYKVQVTDYYNATGASGHPTIRFQRLR